MEEKTAVFFEGITPGIQKPFTVPGESLLGIIERLKKEQNPDILTLIEVLEQFDKLDNQDLIKLRLTFEKVLHG